MLLGHTTFAEQAFQDARLDAIHNNSFGVTQSGLTFSIGTETVAASAAVTLTSTDLSATFSAGSLDFFIWSATDDSETSTWKNVEPGSTD